MSIFDDIRAAYENVMGRGMRVPTIIYIFEHRVDDFLNCADGNFVLCREDDDPDLLGHCWNIPVRVSSTRFMNYSWYMITSHHQSPNAIHFDRLDCDPNNHDWLHEICQSCGARKNRVILTSGGK